jgi:hypothetical protein
VICNAFLSPAEFNRPPSNTLLLDATELCCKGCREFGISPGKKNCLEGRAARSRKIEYDYKLAVFVYPCMRSAGEACGLFTDGLGNEPSKFSHRGKQGNIQLFKRA